MDPWMEELRKEQDNKRQNFLLTPNDSEECPIFALDYLESIDANFDFDVITNLYATDKQNFKSKILTDLAKAPPTAAEIQRYRDLQPQVPQRPQPQFNFAPPIAHQQPLNFLPPIPQRIDGLGSLISKHASKQEIEKYIELHKVDNLNEYSTKGGLPLIWAVQHGREDLIEYFLDRGADINKPTKKGNPPIFAALRDASIHKGRVFKLLLQKGADPNSKDEFQRPADFYADTTTTKYWLNRAREANVAAMIKLFKEVQIPKLAQVYLSLVGQEIATDKTIEDIYGKRSDPKMTKKPVVLFLVGPPGHGKTQISEDIMHVFGNDFIRINCGDIVDAKWGLFGSEPGYVGSTEGTGLANWMEAHNGKVGVVVFEEFEKLGDPVKEALLHPFESGEWSIKKPGRSPYADCSNIIFLITSNWKNQEILRWIDENKALELYAGAKTPEEKRKIKQMILSEISQIIKNEIKRGRVPEFARRIQVVPFVSFNKLQQQVIAEEVEEKMAARYSLPPNNDRKLGNIEIRFTDKFTHKILEDYDPLEGATSIVSQIQQHINSVRLSAAKLPVPPKHVWFYMNEFKSLDFTFAKEKPNEPEEKKPKTSSSSKEEESPASSFLIEEFDDNF